MEIYNLHCIQNLNRNAVFQHLLSSSQRFNDTVICAKALNVNVTNKSNFIPFEFRKSWVLWQRCCTSVARQQQTTAF